MPIRTSDHPTDLPYVAPRLGEHNAEILREMLGKTEAEIDVLAAAGVLATDTA